MPLPCKNGENLAHGKIADGLACHVCIKILHHGANTLGSQSTVAWFSVLSPLICFSSVAYSSSYSLFVRDIHATDAYSANRYSPKKECFSIGTPRLTKLSESPTTTAPLFTSLSVEHPHLPRDVSPSPLMTITTEVYSLNKRLC